MSDELFEAIAWLVVDMLNCEEKPQTPEGLPSGLRHDIHTLVVALQENSE